MLEQREARLGNPALRIPGFCFPLLRPGLPLTPHSSNPGAGGDHEAGLGRLHQLPGRPRKMLPRLDSPLGHCKVPAAGGSQLRRGAHLRNKREQKFECSSGLGFTSGYTKCILLAATGEGAGTGEGMGTGEGSGVGSGAGVDWGAGAALAGELLGVLMVAPTGMLEAQPQCQSARRYTRTTILEMERQLLPGPSLLDHPLGASATTAWSPESGAVWTAGRKGGQTGATRRCAERMLAQLMEAGRTVLHSEFCTRAPAFRHLAANSAEVRAMNPGTHPEGGERRYQLYQPHLLRNAHQLWRDQERAGRKR